MAPGSVTGLVTTMNGGKAVTFYSLTPYPYSSVFTPPSPAKQAALLCAGAFLTCRTAGLKDITACHCQTQNYMAFPRSQKEAQEHTFIWATSLLSSGKGKGDTYQLHNP